MTANKLKYVNQWEYDEYYVGRQRVHSLNKVMIDDVVYPVKNRQVSVNYNDMGHEYSSMSTHFFVVVDVLGIPRDIDLNTVVPRKNVFAVEWS